MARIESPALAPGFQDRAGGAVQVQTGSLMGERVHLKDAFSILEDSREEMSLYQGEKAENKSFADREFGAGPAIDLMQLKEIQAYLEASHRFRDPRLLADLVRQAQASARPRDVVARHTPSPAHQFALLQFALADARTRGLGAEVLERLQDALEDLMLGAGPAIRAGLNIIGAAADFAPTAEGVERFQAAYTDIVIGQATFAQTLLLVLNKLAGAEGEEFKRGLAALMNALGADLSAPAASTDHTRLQALVQDIYQLEVAVSLLEDCGALGRTLEQQFGLAAVSARALMQEMVALTSERWVTDQRMRDFALKFAVQKLLERIAFFSGTRCVLRKMPVKVFSSAESRQGLFDTLQNVLDDAIAEEEERQGA